MKESKGVISGKYNTTQFYFVHYKGLRSYANIEINLDDLTNLTEYALISDFRNPRYVLPFEYISFSKK